MTWGHDFALAAKGKEDEVDIPNNLLSVLGSCDVNSCPNLHCLLVIACTLPVTSVEAERSFSLLQRMKTYTRSTLAEGHLSDLAVIAMHYIERIPVDEVFHTFVQSHPRRLFQASLFADWFCLWLITLCTTISIPLFSNYNNYILKFQPYNVCFN